MESFLLQNFNLINNGVTFFAAIAGIFCLKKYKNPIVSSFVYFLIYVAVFQFVGNYPAYMIEYEFLKPLKTLVEGTGFQRNYWWFNLFWTIGSTLFFSFYFQKILKTKFYKNIVKVSAVIFLLSSIVFIVINTDLFFKSSIPFIALFGAFIIFIYTSLYFFELLKSDRVLTFYKSLNFFICATIFIWWLVTTPVGFFNIYFSKSDWNFVFLRWQIFLFMNIFMYLSFAFAFFWCRPEND